ncbi:CLUMA_CG006346, isoform A, partial [Clunio marinus]
MLNQSRLNDYQIEEWARHTRNRNPAQQIIHHLRAHIHGEFVSQAFAKFYECVSAYPMINNVEKVFHSVHLCEAPGFFITSLNHYLKLNHPEIDFKWHASTLNPYFEGNLIGRTVFDDRLISQTLEKWVFGDDYDGDILKENNIRSLIKYCQSFEHCINLVTADGSIDCSDQPENQEESVSKLHLAELIVSLAILADKGSMLIKMFTFFETSSISILYILNCCFEELHIFKPATSKEGNSEVYVIGIGYKKNVLTNDLIEKMIISFKDETKMLLPLEVIPKEFLHEVVEAARFFMNLQVNVIEGNIKTFQRYDKYENERIRKLKSRMVEHFVMLYKIHPIREEQKILNGLIENIDINLNVRVHTGSHSERINFQYLEQSEKCQVMHDRLKHFYDNFVANTVNSPCIPLNLNNSELSPLKFIKFIYGLSFEKVASSKFVLIP